MADHHQEIISGGSSTTTPDRHHEEVAVVLERAGSTTSFNGGAGAAVVGTPDVHGAGIKIQRAKIAYETYVGHEEKPTKLEVVGWSLYGLCSYFIHTVLIPIVFPLIISQIASPMPKDINSHAPPAINDRGFVCANKELLLYNRLTNRTITVNDAKYSPLEWTAISWAIGLALAAPALGLLSAPLDRGPHQAIIATAATAIGAVFCLPAGFFRTVWIFPPYIAVIVAASTVAATYHTRHLGLMVSGFTGKTIQIAQFPLRRAAAGWLSLAATAAGSLGSAVISSFTYHMLREDEELMSLWIVSIFSGIKWLLGAFHFINSNNRAISTTPPPISKTHHAFSILRYPHAIGSLVSIFFSSLSTMCTFTGALLFMVGELCFKPKSLLHFWLAYFLFPIISLPILHPIQHLLRANAVKMQVLGFFLTAAISGMGFSSRSKSWGRHYVLIFAAIQSMATGILYAFGRVLLLDCSPPGKEGVFSSWFVWFRVLGSCVGFAIASAVPGNVGVSFGVGFCTAISAVVVLIFGNVSDFGGAVDAGHVTDDHDVNVKDRERGSPVSGVDTATGADVEDRHQHV